MSDSSVLFVCFGNICRSPMAEAVMRQLLAQRGLAARICVDSCGTAAIHAGKPADPRAIAALHAAGYRTEARAARQIRDADFREFRWILALDQSNLHTLRAWAPPEFDGELALLTRFARRAHGGGVEDPYHAGTEAFASALREIESGVNGLLQAIESTLDPETSPAPVTACKAVPGPHDR